MTAFNSEIASPTPPHTPKSTPGSRQQETVLKWPLRYKSLVMDLGDVFCSWSKGGQSTPISAFDLKKIIESPDWHDYERGKLEKQECWALLDKKFGLKDGELEQTIKIFAEGMQWNNDLVNEIRKIKAMSHGELGVFLMTNISQPDFESLRPVVESWNIFDKVFTSAGAGVRKPELAFYQSVLKDVGTAADSVIFVDDKTENVILAQSAGMHGMVFESTAQVVRELNVLFGDSVRNAKGWIEAHAGEMWSVTETGVEVREQFSHLVMLEMSVDKNFLAIREDVRHWNTFIGKPVGTDADFPDDFDTTSFALLNLDIPDDVKNSVMDEMLDYPRSDGLFVTYFDPQRPRTCPYVNANILRLFYANNRGHQARDTVDRMVQVLETGAYRFGTRYYQSPEWFLYYLADLCAKNSTAIELEKMRTLLKTHIRAEVGNATNYGAAAFRVLSAQLLSMDDDVAPDLAILLRNQDPDGSWSRDPWVWRYGRSGIQAGNVGLVTSIAAKAVQNAGEDRIKRALRVW